MHPSVKCFCKAKTFFLHFYEAFFTSLHDQNSNFLHDINHKIIHKSEDIILINLIFSTNGHLLCILLTSAFAKLKLFFFTFMKHFLLLYEIKIQIFSITSTTKSSSEDIDLINLIFSTNGHLLCIPLLSAFAHQTKFSP